MWLMMDEIRSRRYSMYIDLKKVNEVYVTEYFFPIDEDDPDFSVWVVGPGILDIVKVFKVKEDAGKFALQLLRVIDLDKRGLCQHEEAPYVIDTEDIMAETY